MTFKIGLFYGTDTGNTEDIALEIQKKILWANVNLHEICEASPELILSYDYLILGIPTWDFGGIQTDWEEYWEIFSMLDFSKKFIALFGLGDQIGYPEYFLDAMGLLHDVVVKNGANITGQFSIEGFAFKESKALSNDKNYFVGLAIDEDQQHEISSQRIDSWIQSISLSWLS
jgi:flavodoxin I